MSLVNERKHNISLFNSLLRQPNKKYLALPPLSLFPLKQVWNWFSWIRKPLLNNKPFLNFLLSPFEKAVYGKATDTLSYYFLSEALCLMRGYFGPGTLNLTHFIFGLQPPQPCFKLWTSLPSENQKLLKRNICTNSR